MWMASDQLGYHGLYALGHGKALLLLSHTALKDNVEQQVSQLFLERLRIISLNTFDDLVGLFKHIRNETGGSLLSIPRTALRRAQALDDGQKLEQRFSQLHGLSWRGL